jgi:hypothetical protein
VGSASEILLLESNDRLSVLSEMSIRDGGGKGNRLAVVDVENAFDEDEATPAVGRGFSYPVQLRDQLVNGRFVLLVRAMFVIGQAMRPNMRQGLLAALARRKEALLLPNRSCLPRSLSHLEGKRVAVIPAGRVALHFDAERRPVVAQHMQHVVFFVFISRSTDFLMISLAMYFAITRPPLSS